MRDQNFIQNLLASSFRQIHPQTTLVKFIAATLLKHPQATVAIEGPSGSGKTTFAFNLAQELTFSKTNLISLDDYVRFSPEEMHKQNILTRYDWRSRDKTKFLSDIAALKRGKKIHKPLQDFSKEKPSSKMETITACPYIILEGNLDLSDVADLIIFLFAPDEILLERRLNRDQQKLMHQDQQTLLLSAKQSLVYYHQILEPQSIKAHFLINTATTIIYKKT